MSVRAGIVVTGNEVLAGRVQDRNGPWLSKRLEEMGVEVTHLVVCADRPTDINKALEFLADQGVDLAVTSGGLGPTEDDLTAEVVADFAGVQMVHDAEIETRIGERIRPYAKQWQLDPDALVEANRKQAMVPNGAIVLGPAGTAPGLVLKTRGLTIVVLPGPPGEMQRLWREAVKTEQFGTATAGSRRLGQRTLRLFGIPEAELAQTLRDLGKTTDMAKLEINTCSHAGELEVVIRWRPADKEAAQAVFDGISEHLGRYLFSTDGTTVDDQVAEMLAGRRLALGESCTGGLIGGRITARPGSSGYFAGGIVAYGNEAKTELLGVDRDLIESAGAVSEDVAAAMARGALNRLDADVGLGITGIAGPTGGTQEKPIGTVCVTLTDRDGRAFHSSLKIPGNRREIRERATNVSMHLLRIFLAGSSSTDPGDPAQEPPLPGPHG